MATVFSMLSAVGSVIALLLWIQGQTANAAICLGFAVLCLLDAIYTKLGES